MWNECSEGKEVAKVRSNKRLRSYISVMNYGVSSDPWLILELFIPVLDTYLGPQSVLLLLHLQRIHTLAHISAITHSCLVLSDAVCSAHLLYLMLHACFMTLSLVNSPFLVCKEPQSYTVRGFFILLPWQGKGPCQKVHQELRLDWKNPPSFAKTTPCKNTTPCPPFLHPFIQEG